MLQILENSSMGKKETKAVYNELLNLFSVSNSALLSKAKQMQLEQQHKIDSYTEYYTESEIGILNGVKRIVSLIERHSR